MNLALDTASEIFHVTCAIDSHDLYQVTPYVALAIHHNIYQVTHNLCVPPSLFTL